MALSLGTNGVRGLLDELTPAAAADFGFGFAKFCRQDNAGAFPSSAASSSSGAIRPCIALARDMRLTSPAIAQAVASGLMEGGVDVLDLGIATSPMAEWLAHRHECAGLVIVTASHNPPEWNALKFVDGQGVAVSRERGRPIEKYVGQPHAPVLSWEKIGKIRQAPDPVGDYSKAVLSFVDRRAIGAKKKWRIVFDPGNGTSTLVAPAILKSLGAEVVMLNEQLDGRFPGRPSEPTEANVKSLIDTVSLVGADFGVACDGDADRVVFVDDAGRWLVGDKCVALCAGWMLREAVQSSKPPYYILTTVATSRVVEDVAKKYGATTVYTSVGAPYLAEKFVELGSSAIGGGEEVGGIVFPRFSLAKDGVLAACKLMEMVAQKPLSKWHDELPKYFNAKTKIICTPAQKKKMMEKLRGLGQKEKKSAGDTSRLILLPEGFRLDFEDSWVIARASGTENYVRVFAEGKTEKQAKELMEEYEMKVKGILD